MGETMSHVGQEMVRRLNKASQGKVIATLARRARLRMEVAMQRRKLWEAGYTDWGVGKPDREEKVQ